MGWLKYPIAAALISFLGFGSYLFWVTAQSEKQIAAQASSTLSHVDATIADLTRKCTPIKGQVLTVDTAKNCGLLPQIAITLNTFRGTMGQFEVALAKENRASDDLHNTQVSVAKAVDKLGDAGEQLGGTAKSVGELAGSINRTVTDLDNQKTGIPATVANVNDGVTELREYLKSKEMKQITADVQTTIHHTAGISDSADKMLVDAQWKTHQLLHPDKVKVGFWGTFVAGTWFVVKQLKPSIF